MFKSFEIRTLFEFRKPFEFHQPWKFRRLSFMLILNTKLKRPTSGGGVRVMHPEQRRAHRLDLDRELPLRLLPFRRQNHVRDH